MVRGHVDSFDVEALHGLLIGTPDKSGVPGWRQFRRLRVLCGRFEAECSFRVFGVLRGSHLGVAAV
jgi:hypothetical protein